MSAPAIDSSSLKRVVPAARVEDEDLPRLGFGLMRLPVIEGSGAVASSRAGTPQPAPEELAAIDIEQVEDMVDAYMAAGMNYFDTAYMYMNGRSEKVVGEVLVARYPRDAFFLATKLPRWSLKERADVERIFQEQLARTGAGYFDLYLLHNIDSPESYGLYSGFGCFEWAQEKKAAGQIRHFGFSFHGGPELLERILSEHPEVEFVQLQLNYLDWENPVIQSRANWEVCRRRGIPNLVMEPVKGGKLADPVPAAAALLEEAAPEASAASWALRFISGKPGIMTTLSGMSTRAQMADNLATMGPGFRPLSPAEEGVLERVVEAFRTAPTVECTACRYCVEGCPMGIPITDVIRALNAYRLDSRTDRAKGWYERVTAAAGRASECVRCGQCEGNCPQHLPVIALMREAAEAFEGV